MNAEPSQSIPSFIPVRKSRNSIAQAKFILTWSYGPVNDYVRTAILKYLKMQQGVLAVDFPGNNNTVAVQFDPQSINKDAVLKCLECPQIKVETIIAA